MLLTTALIAYKYINAWFSVLLVIDSVLIGIVESVLLIMMSAERYDLMQYYLAIKILWPIIHNYGIRPKMYDCAREIERDFSASNIVKYDRLAYESKNVKPSGMFWGKNSKAQSAIFVLVDWGLPTILSLIGTMVSVIVTLVQKGLAVNLVIIVIFYVVFYYAVIRHKQNSYSDNSKAKNKIRQGLDAIEFDSLSI